MTEQDTKKRNHIYDAFYKFIEHASCPKDSPDEQANFEPDVDGASESDDNGNVVTLADIQRHKNVLLRGKSGLNPALAAFKPDNNDIEIAAKVPMKFGRGITYEMFSKKDKENKINN